MELWDLYTEDRILTGKQHIRGQELPDDFFHLVIHVWIRNENGQYLISQRSASRPTCPLMWECVGGSVLQGENSLQGAIREVKEEVGIDLQPENGKIVYSKVRKLVDGRKFNDIMDVWVFEYNGEVALENATTDEVEQSVWMNKEQIEELWKQKKLVDTFLRRLDKASKNEKGKHMSRAVQVELMNMCMVYDDQGRILVQDRNDAGWKGLSFPGGHVEPEESFTDAVIREVYEETGLVITAPQLCGVKDWTEEDGTRCQVLLYKTCHFSGELKSSEEGEVFWIHIGDFQRQGMARSMDHTLRVFLEEDCSEHFIYKEDDEWKHEVK